MRSLSSLLLARTGACASAGGGTRPSQAPAPVATVPAPASTETTSVARPQYPSTYVRHPNPPVLIRKATIMTATGQEIPKGSILFKDGRIVAVGAKVDAPSDAVVVDGTGKYVTPGLIDDQDRKSTRLNSSHGSISYAVFCLKKKKKKKKKKVRKTKINNKTE